MKFEGKSRQLFNVSQKCFVPLFICSQTVANYIKLLLEKRGERKKKEEEGERKKKKQLRIEGRKQRGEV